MRLVTRSTPVISAPRNGGSVSMRAALGVGPTGATGATGATGPQGPPGPGTGAGAWQPATAYTANQVVQAPDGSMISRNTTGTSRASFDATEEAEWTAVLGKAGTVEANSLAASFVAATVAVGDGIDPTMATDSAPVIQALIDAANPGDNLIFPVGDDGSASYRLDTQLVINKSLSFGGTSTIRATNDNSHQDAGVQFVYTGTSGDAILVQAPEPDVSNDNGKISVHLANFMIRGNKAVVGATGGGGLTLDGRDIALGLNSAISQFTVTDVKVCEAKGDGFTVTGQVYEGRVTGLSAFRNGGKGVNTTAVELPGEILWTDIHTNDNDGDGAYITGAGTHQILRWSSSRNGDHGAHFKDCAPTVIGLQCETNAGAEVVTIEDCVQAVLVAPRIDYTEPSYVGTGIAVTGTSENVAILGPKFGGTSTTWDISTGASTSGTYVLNPRSSAANKVSFGGSNELMVSGGKVVKGTFQVESDGVNRVPAKVKGYSGQAVALQQWLNSLASILAYVDQDGNVLSNRDITARFGRGAGQAAIGAFGPTVSGTVKVAIYLNGHYLWFDDSHNFRTKFGAPTTDTDGVVVGTQT